MNNRDKPATVLVADDDDAVRQFVRTAIEQIGLKVCEASNGREVLEQFTLRHPDVIVMDVMMPVMDGFAACAKLRGEPRGGQIPILMMNPLTVLGVDGLQERVQCTTEILWSDAHQPAEFVGS